MKKIIFLTCINVLLFHFAKAQITITNADMPAVNDTFRLSSTNNIQGLDPTLTGTNFTWDFSTLVAANQKIDTFFSVASTPLAYQFYFNNIFLYPNHKASYATKGPDIGIPQVPITEVFNFIKNSSSAYDNVGFGSKIAGVPSSTRNMPVDREYVFPMTYNSNHTSNSAFGISVPTFGYYGESMERIDTVDGWGSLTLPNGTYNVLRVKSILNKIDTTYLDTFSIGTAIARPKEIEYKWLAAGKGVPLLKIVTIAGNVVQIEYQDDAVVGIDEINALNNLTAFPNPATNYLIIDFNARSAGNLKVSLRDILGKETALIYHKNIVSGNNRLLINLTQYAIKSGIYFATFLVDGKQYLIKKIIVTK